MLDKNIRRLRRKARVRARIEGTSERPRLSVFRSNANIYAQIIDDKEGKTIVASSDLKMAQSGTKTDMAVKVGEDIAKKALESNVNNVVFDRNGFEYHGRVKALAEAARKAGLEF